ncbi:hypothetical protein CDL12_01764 [Handroanthus impetiginosus]|uniref:Uncharacterized protein n=1 Tax=Handroanthus impetiginosus TaxID=429701 RepID=A0A2G9I6V1_9LAMI|nr:hypothetical protein CDL12_01764 [Handroanthus impetiginosus]
MVEDRERGHQYDEIKSKNSQDQKNMEQSQSSPYFSTVNINLTHRQRIPSETVFPRLLKVIAYSNLIIGPLYQFPPKATIQDCRYFKRMVLKGYCCFTKSKVT